MRVDRSKIGKPFRDQTVGRRKWDGENGTGENGTDLFSNFPLLLLGGYQRGFVPVFPFSIVFRLAGVSKTDPDVCNKDTGAVPL